MDTPTRPRYFSARAALVGAVVASVVGLPILIIDLYEALGPIARPFVPTVQRTTTVQRSPGILPPLLTGLIELEYQRNGVEGVVDLMGQVDGPMYKDIVYSYLITMLLGQNTDIRGVSSYEPNPFGANPSDLVPIDYPPVAAPAAALMRREVNDISNRRDRDTYPRSLVVSFEQPAQKPTNPAPGTSKPDTDKDKIARATRLAALITEPQYRIYMLVEIGKTRAAIDKDAKFDAATVQDGLKVLNHVQKHLIGYHPSSADYLEVAQQLARSYATLEFWGSSPAAIRRSLRAEAERYLDELIELKIPYPNLDPRMRQLAHADALVDSAMSRSQSATEEDRKASAARYDATWASLRTLLLAGVSALFCGLLTPLVNASGRWLLRKSSSLTGSQAFLQEADHVLKTEPKSGSKDSDHKQR
jgi:hypothetical protein